MPRGIYPREPDCNLGSDNPNAILNENQVRIIKRHLRDKTRKRTDLAKRYHVSLSLIQEIAKERRWGHIKI